MRTPVPWPSDERLRELLKTKNGGEIARMLGCTPEAVNARARARGLRDEAPTTEASSVAVEGDEATVTLPLDASPDDIPALLESFGLDPDEWIQEYARPNVWQAFAGTNDDGDPIIVNLRQLKVSLRRRLSLQMLSPATHVPELVKSKSRKRSASEPEMIVVEGDHHVPYHEPDLDAAACALIADLQPTEIVELGDLMDLPTISRHKDHPAAAASPQDCINEGYALLRRRAEAAPNARRRMVRGNHDDRIESEQLLRAERLSELAPAGEEDVPAHDLRRLLHLDRLGYELITNGRGWSHAEVELVPGRDGLVVRHGFVTGQKTAEKTLNKLGRSAIVGHKHSQAHVWRLDYPERVLRQTVVAGCMCRNDDTFPHFTEEPDWHQGLVTVARWPDGKFLIEHAVWDGGFLHWRDRRY